METSYQTGVFEGVQSGLKWLQRVKRNGHVHDNRSGYRKHVYEALKYGVDML